MAFIPAWFDYDVYMNNKLDQMKNLEPTSNWTMDKLVDTFAENGFVGKEGAYNHFVAYGANEEVSPNADFNAEAYYISKAAQFYGVKPSEVTESQVAAMVKAFDDNGLNAWTHYQLYGTSEGVNPSNDFDTSAYMDAKLAQMQVEDPDYTMADLVAAFDAAGLSALEHYFLYGKDEGITATPVSGDEIIPDEPQPDPDPENPGETINLTVNQDNLTGTAGDDTFNAYIFDNQNTLQSGDSIDGGAGEDTLFAQIGVSQKVVITPVTNNVEIGKFQAQAQNGTVPGSNNVDDIHGVNGTQDTYAQIDAQYMKGMKQFWSQDSRADLVIEDVREDSNTVTVGMANTDPGDVDFELYFDPQHLKAEDSKTTGTLFAQLIDTVGALDPATSTKGEGHDNPLWDNPYTGFKFTLNGKEHILNFGAYNHETDSDGTPTYEELVQQMREAIKNNPELSQLGLTVELGKTFTAKVGIGPNQGATVEGTEIVIESSQGALEGGNWVAENGLPPTNSTSATFDADTQTTCPLISTNVALDNVGRVQWEGSDCLPSNDDYGSHAGDLVIGSMATRGGVERFNVTVDQGSWLSSMSSTNNTLRAVVVTNGDLNDDATDGNNGNLYIGDSQEGGNAMVAWQDAPTLLSSTGLTDVKTFDGSAFTGDLNIGAQITAASFDKYLKDVDGVDSMAESYAPNGPFAYSLGSGNDVLNLVVDGGVAADNDFKMEINAGTGDDFVNFTFNDFTLNERANQIALNNVTINAGAGDDVVKFWGDGAVKVNGGAGDDAIYVGQNGADHNAVWVLNAGTDLLARSIYADAVNGAQPLNNNVLSTQESFGFSSATAGEDITVTVSFKGIASKVTIVTADAATGTLSAEEINAAIIKAINENPILNKLLVAKDGAGHSLLIESLIDGEMTDGDFGVTFGGATLATGTQYDDTFASAVDQVAVATEIRSGDNTAGEWQNIYNVDQMGFHAGDIVSVVIDEDGTPVRYSSAELTGTTVADIVAALNAAQTPQGGPLNPDVTFTAVGNDIQITYAHNGIFAQDVDNAVLYKVSSTQENGTDLGTTSSNTVNAGTGDDVIVLNVASTAANHDTVVFDGTFGNDVVMNFQSTVDTFDVSAYDADSAALGAKAFAGVTDYHTVLNDTGINDIVKGTNIYFVENTSTAGVHDYYVFQVNAAADGTIADTDTITLLGTVTTGTEAIVLGDIVA